MKRLHIHVAVADLAESIRFYSAMFAAEPSVIKPDYAKWMLDDPRVNFAISRRGAAIGLNHLGVQVESAEELAEMHARLENLQTDLIEETGTACCYAKSDKYWANDPQGIPWETFHTLDSIPVFGAAEANETACCVPLAHASQKEEASPCCIPLHSDKTAAGGCC
jgi:catechol 2,3-dioxygenase-like lactoylglutathione lyase family enzyme